MSQREEPGDEEEARAAERAQAEEPITPSAPAPERRHALLQSVAAWIDELGEPEPPPAGLDADQPSAPDRAPDLYALLAQLAALTRESQLQGRATNRLHTELSAAFQRLADNVASPDALLKRLADARREARIELVAELLEARDRFARGLGEARRRLSGLSGLRARFGQRPVLESLVEGNALALERLDDTLRRLDVHEIAAQGKPFDPRTMRALEVVTEAGVAPGTVLEVFRTGYTTDGRVLRFAEVKVAGDRPAAPGGPHD